jgi:hypothetical protein
MGMHDLEVLTMATHEQVNDFANFALEKLNSGQADFSMDELYDMWRRENPDPADYAENVAAVQMAIDDLKAGDRGRPAGELTRELRKELDEA